MRLFLLVRCMAGEGDGGVSKREKLHRMPHGRGRGSKKRAED